VALRDVVTVLERPRLDGHRIARLVLLAAALVAGLTFILLVPLRFNSYGLREGDVAPTNIRAPKHVQYVSAIETKAEKARAANSVAEQFAFDGNVASQQRGKMVSGLQSIAVARANTNTNATTGPTVDARKNAIRRAFADFDLTDDQLNLLLGMDNTRWQVFSTDSPRILYDLLAERVPAERLRDLRREAWSKLGNLADQDRDLAADLVQRLAKVNYIPNPAETERLRKDAQDAIAPVSKTVEQSEIILREGDIVRATDLEKLEELGLRNPTVDWRAVTASALLALLMVCLVAGYVWVFEPALLIHEKRLLLVALVMLVTVLGAKALLPDRPNGTYVFPLSAVAMLLATLVDAQLAILVTVLLSLVVAIVAGNSLEVASIGLVGAVVGSLGVRRSERLHSYFVAGGMVALANFAVIAAFTLMAKDDDWAKLALNGGLSVMNGVLSASLTVGTFSLLGRLFGITTTLQLLELSDPTQPLLRRLLNEAPGTYHHSIMVGNLAERAAERVGADALLVRVGAYYHDVGKLARPYFFIENQFDGKNVHDSLDPQTSARVVVSHVRDGLELAEKYKLPPRVREFISEHHGTRMATYFFNQASREGDGQVDASQYAYPGPRPRSKEAAIVMLADSVEAVVRAANDHSPDNVAKLVRKVVDERVEEGQLDECDLTMRDVEEIKRAFIAILMGMYHPRIEYPPAAIPATSVAPAILAPAQGVLVQFPNGDEEGDPDE
jgi:cyclic-di-AMP phosphodiesterase PgpH